MVSTKLRLQSYLEPLILLSLSVIFLPLTLLRHPLLPLYSPSTFRSKWFQNMWNLIGPKMAAAPHQVPYVEALLSRAHGTVLELGPGTGDQAYHFKPKKIDVVYGAEPNRFLHEKLVENSKKVGIKEYVALECGAEPASLLPALKEAGLIPASAQTLPEKGIFDTIIAIKSMCSAPQQQLPATMAVVQALLKPGGEFVFFEHLHNDSDNLTGWFVWCLNMIWPYFMGNCHMNARLDKVVNGMGGWRVRDMTNIGEFHGYEPFRYMSGVCKK